ncbi:MAG: hypothetical protein ACREMF_07930 [Gemmatimonadales bacterium]
MRRRGVLLSLALCCATAVDLGAQRPIRVQGTRALSFGTILPGVRRSVARTDPVNTGLFDIRAVRFSQLQLIFTLPSAMRGPGGATLPLNFSGNDGGFSTRRSRRNQVGFDPRAPFLASMGPRNRATVFLGGTANPRTSQRAGAYTGTVSLTVVYLP